MQSSTWKTTTHPHSRDPGAGFLLLGALLVFVPNLTGYFLSDDFVLLSWTQAHSLTEVAAFFDPNTEWFYRPGVKVIYWLGQSVFGLHATPFHFFSLFLHGANGYMVYHLVSRQLRGSTGWVTGVAAGLLFLLNPHHAETVSWVAAVGDLAGVFCILATLILFLRFLETRRLRYLLASVALFTMGLFTRETVVILPLLLLLAILTLRPQGRKLKGKATFEHRPGTTFDRLRGILPLLPYLLPLLLYFAVQALGRSGGSTLARGGLKFLPLNADSIVLGVMDYVHGLVPGGNLLAGLGLDALRVVVWVELAAILLLAVAFWRARWRVALFGLGWLMLTPLIFVFFNAPTDRYFYLPSVGYTIVAASLVVKVPRIGARLRLPLAPWKLLAAGVAGVLVLTQGLSLATKIQSWHLASQASSGVINDALQAVPEAPTHSNFYFVGLPPFMDGVPTFQNALPQALQLLYMDSTLSGTIVTCEQLESAQLPQPAYFFRFKGNGTEQFTDVQNCRK